MILILSFCEFSLRNSITDRFSGKPVVAPNSYADQVLHILSRNEFVFNVTTIIDLTYSHCLVHLCDQQLLVTFHISTVTKCQYAYCQSPVNLGVLDVTVVTKLMKQKKVGIIWGYYGDPRITAKDNMPLSSSDIEI